MSDYIESHVVESAVELFLSATGEMPVGEQAEWKSFTAADADALEELVDEVNYSDLLLAVRAAADRLNSRASDA